VNDVPTPTWAKMNSSLLQAGADGMLRFKIDHQGTQRIVELKATDVRDTERALGNPPIPALVRPVDRGTPASRAGLQRGDLVLSVNGAPVRNWFDFYEIITHSNGQVLNTVVRRSGNEVKLEIHPLQNKDEEGVTAWRIGVAPEGEWAFKPMTFSASVKEASDETLGATAKLFGVMGRLFTGKLSVKQLRSFVGIAAMAGQAVEEGPVDVITMMAMISLNLGILNLLPIPILDGGNILLLTMEAIRRRDFSLAFKERFVQVGLVFLLVFFAYVMYNDVVRLLPTHS
jgi:regulator of sigma E protease